MNVSTRNKKPILQRFQKFIELDLLTGCWFWKGYLNEYGYGIFRPKNTIILSHRFAFEYWNGNIPKDRQIDHLCRNRNCCNPSHLELVTPKENIQRGISHNRELTHCINGHEFNEKNTAIRLEGGRRCRVCQNINSKKSYRKMKNNEIRC